MAGSGLVASFADKDPSFFFLVSLPFVAQILVPWGDCPKIPL